MVGLILAIALAWASLAAADESSRLNAYALDLEQELKRVMVQCAGRRVELDRRAHTIEQLEQEVARLRQELHQLKNPPQEE